MQLERGMVSSEFFEKVHLANRMLLPSFWISHHWTFILFG